MNKSENKPLIAIPTFLVLTVLSAASALAQTPAAANNNRSDATRGLAFAPRLRLSLTTAGFRLMPATSASTNPGSRSSTISLVPMAAGPSLQVLGGGTLGRLAKWTGFTSSNSFIGNSTIFEDKFGNVGIGTDTPTSRLTVAGMIQSTIGGFKFPDGTVQTSSAAGALFTVAHDATLMGDGTTASPLGVAVPLILSGSDNSNGVIIATNTGAGGTGIFTIGGNASPTIEGGAGLLSLGGTGSGTSSGGEGLVTFGGPATEGSGGTGGSLIGGASTAGTGGRGLLAIGGPGAGAGKKGGSGIRAIPGSGSGGATAGLAGEFLGDVEITGNTLVTSAGKGIILKSPDGATCRLLSIDNAGNIVLTAIPCP
jgi:hypothetical protein